MTHPTDIISFGCVAKPYGENPRNRIGTENQIHMQSWIRTGVQSFDCDVKVDFVLRQLFNVIVC